MSDALKALDKLSSIAFANTSNEKHSLEENVELTETIRAALSAQSETVDEESLPTFKDLYGCAPNATRGVPAEDFISTRRILKEDFEERVKDALKTAERELSYSIFWFRHYSVPAAMWGEQIKSRDKCKDIISILEKQEIKP